MNKENKTLNLALRIGIILTWIMSNVSLFMIFSGLKNINTDGLNKDNVADRMLDVISGFAKNTSLYYVVIGMTGACLLLSIVTRYKTSIVSFIFKILSIGFTLLCLITGTEYINALRSCKDLADGAFSGHDAASVAATLTEAGVADAEAIAKTLTDPDKAAAALGAYLFPILIFFILTITSIHCLVKRSDPNNRNQQNVQEQY